MTDPIDYAFPGYQVIGVEVGTPITIADGTRRLVTEISSVIVGTKIYTSIDTYNKMVITPAPSPKPYDSKKFYESLDNLSNQK
jgi:hypothetical protein